MKNRTQDEINKEIEKLEKLKKGIPQMSAFGDDNHKIIEYQIDILKGNILMESEIDNITRFDDEEDDDDSKELNQSEANSINEAFNFLSGYADELVSEEELEIWSKE